MAVERDALRLAEPEGLPQDARELDLELPEVVAARPLDHVLEVGHRAVAFGHPRFQLPHPAPQGPQPLLPTERGEAPEDREHQPQEERPARPGRKEPPEPVDLRAH